MTLELKEQKFMELMRVSRMQSQIDQLMNKLTSQVIEQQITLGMAGQDDLPVEMEALAQKLQEELPEIIIEVLGNDFSPFMITLYTELMSSHFTEEEVNKLIDLYEDPLMQKMITVSTAAMPKYMEGCSQYMLSKLPEVKTRLQNLMSDFERDQL